LDNYEQVRFCIRCGAALERQPLFGALRPVCPQCHWVYFADPKVAVGALVTQERHFLLVQRNHEPQRGLWTFPAGFLDAGEDPARAAERECREETGLLVQATNLLRVVSGREHPWGADLLLIYRAELVGGDLCAGDDADQAQFFPCDALPPLAFHHTREILLASLQEGTDLASDEED
jgi:ADP-ribose pyrophosphatase YjhB (NUDIX family)